MPKIGGAPRPDDSLAVRYSSVADDGKMSAKQREVCLLLSTAEDKFNKGGDEQEVLQLAMQARGELKSAGDRRGSVDATRLAIHALLSIAEVAQVQGSKDTVNENTVRADRLAEEEMQDAQQRGDTRSKAAMLLALAEINMLSQGQGKSYQAFQGAKEAESILEAQHDDKLTPSAMLLLSRLYCKTGDRQHAENYANTALDGFGRVGDKRGEAQACEARSQACMLSFDYEEAIKALQQCIQVLRENDMKALFACKLANLAELMMQRGDGYNALPAAKEAYGILADLEYGRGQESRALSILVRCYLALSQKSKAQRVAKAAMNAFKQRAPKDRTELYQAMITYSTVKQAEGDQEEATKVLKETLQLCQENFQPFWEARTLQELAAAYEKAGEYSKALAMAEQSSELHSSTGDSQKEVSTLVHIVTKLQLLSDQSKEAAATAERARDIAEKIEDTSLQAWACLASFSAHMQLMDADMALRSARDAQELFEEDGDRKGEARALQSISRCYCGTEQYRLAVRAAEDELAIHREVGDRMAVGIALLSISDIHLMDHKPKDVITMAREALAVFSAEGATGMSVQGHLNIAKAYDELLKNLGPAEARGAQFNELFAKGVKSSKEAIRAADQTGDQVLEAAALYWSGSLYAIAGKSQDTIQAATESLSLCKQSNDKKGEVRAQSLIGQAMILKQNLKSAKKVLTEALELAKDIDDEEGIKLLKELLREAEPRQVQMQQVSQAAGVMVQQEAQAASAAGPAGAVSAYQAPSLAVVRERIVAMVADMTGETGTEADTPFMDSGIDSLASVELRTSLQKQFGVSLPSTVMFNYPTTNSMVDYLIGEMTEAQVSLS